MDIEQEIVESLVSNILDRGFSIDLYGEGELLLSQSLDRNEVLDLVDACDYMEIYFADGQRFLIIGGNGEDIISDCSDTPLCEEIFKEIQDDHNL